MHGFAQRAGQGQAQARAAVLASGADLSLRKRLEYLVPLVGADANTGILYTDAYAVRAGAQTQVYPGRW